MGQTEVRALNGIDLTVEKNEYLAIMGSSGSGKSTLMNVIGCLDSPTDGTYLLNGKRVSDMPDDELAGIRNAETSTTSTNRSAMASAMFLSTSVLNATTDPNAEVGSVASARS